MVRRQTNGCVSMIPELCKMLMGTTELGEKKKSNLVRKVFILS